MYINKQRNDKFNWEFKHKIKLCLLQRDCLLLIKPEVEYQIGLSDNLMSYKQIIATVK